VEIHQLQYVLEVAKQRHFTRAADEICVAQSSLSQQITKLEEELGIKIFDRTTRSVFPTAAGEEFIDYARRILDEIEAAKQCMQSYVGLSRGKINIGAITTLETIDFVSLITAFHNTYPGLYLNISTNGSYRLTELVKTGEINVAMLTPPMDTETDDLEYYPLGEDEFVLVASIHHPFAKKEIADLAQFANEDFIFPSPDQSIYKIYMKACREAGFSPNIVCQSSHSETALALVAAGMGLSFFPLDTLKATNAPGVMAIRLVNPIKKRICLVLPRRQYHPASVLAFRDFVLSWAKAKAKKAASEYAPVTASHATYPLAR
jgi:Transcriptional regulator